MSKKPKSEPEVIDTPANLGVIEAHRGAIEPVPKRRLGQPPKLTPAVSKTICDAMQAVTPGAVPFEAAEELISRGVTVDDEAVRRAMRVAFEEFKIVLEPSGAIALAAALEHKDQFSGRTLVLLCCGGSVSLEDLLRLTSTAH